MGRSMTPPSLGQTDPAVAVQVCKTGYKCCYNSVLWWYRPIGMSPRMCLGARKLRVRFRKKNGAFDEPPILALFGPLLLCSCVKPVISVIITLFYGGIDPLGCLLGFARVPGSYA